MLNFLLYVSELVHVLKNVCSFLWWIYWAFILAGIYEKFAIAFSQAVQSMQVGEGFTEGVVQVVIQSDFQCCWLMTKSIELLYLLYYMR